MRIVRLANFITGSSGGLRTALRELGTGYLAAGHEPVLIMPGAVDSDEQTGQGRVITLAGPVVPGTGGYRVLVARSRLRRLLTELAPDRLEVSDRTTLRWTGRWARRAGVPSVMVSHETLDGLLGLPFGGRRASARLTTRIADRLNAATAASFDTVLCTTGWAAREFARIGVDNLVRVPLGVDLERFHPRCYDPAVRQRYAPAGELLVLHCARLSAEKCPERVLAALAQLRRRRVAAVGVFVGTGPRQAGLREQAAAAGLAVHFANYVDDRTEIARLMASADVVVAPGPVETFGLAALEALASGTPVVVAAESALPEVVADAGLAATGGGVGFADAIVELARRPESARRAAARARAERFPWSASVDGFLRAHRTVGTPVGLRLTGR
ncbi:MULTISPECIES: glycosyltransferase [unclassified Solwaraspora]|uniref:glycosyltransferase n=1 Tax=unclassified Solwaraspora TaxID=2627926 RepID=UPI00259BEABB|nr:glycosyltransferase [Solwaraspora sp. WMMA2056]WJK39555.1 glycosyltransferase [Solwaraspora sp. WMMA2056]